MTILMRAWLAMNRPIYRTGNRQTCLLTETLCWSATVLFAVLCYVFREIDP